MNSIDDGSPTEGVAAERNHTASIATGARSLTSSTWRFEDASGAPRGFHRSLDRTRMTNLARRLPSVTGTARLTSSHRRSYSRLLLSLNNRVQTTSARSADPPESFLSPDEHRGERVDGKLGDADLPVEECAESAARSFEKRHSPAHRYSKARSTRRRLSSGLLPLFSLASPPRRAHARPMRWRRWWGSCSFSAPRSDEAGGELVWR